jgi:hypothetical protein
MFSWRYGVIGDSLFPAWERSLPLLDERGNQVHCDRFDNILVLQRRWTKPGQVDHWRRHAGVDETRFEVDNEGTTFVTVARAADQLADDFVELAPEIGSAGKKLLEAIEPPRKNDSVMSWAAEESAPTAHQQPAGPQSVASLPLQSDVPKRPQAGSDLAANVLVDDRAYFDGQRQEQARREEAEQRWKEHRPKLVRINSALADFGAVLRTNWQYRHFPRNRPKKSRAPRRP